MKTKSSHGAADVQRERDPLGMINGEGVITGTVVSAAVIAAAVGHLEETRLVLTILGTAFIYWLAHLHARTLGDAVKHHTHPVDALKEALAETWPILAAALVPAVILIVDSTRRPTNPYRRLDCRDREHGVVDDLQLLRRPTRWTRSRRQRVERRHRCPARAYWLLV